LFIVGEKHGKNQQKGWDYAGLCGSQEKSNDKQAGKIVAGCMKV
jgi:hypothetical protein